MRVERHILKDQMGASATIIALGQAFEIELTKRLLELPSIISYYRINNYRC